MKKIMYSMMTVGALMLASCSSDDDSNSSNIETSNLEGPTAARILLNSIDADGGISYNQENPALTFTDAQNVFLPSVLGIDYRTDRSVVPAGPTARFPMFQGWEIVNGTPRAAYYIITEASDRATADELGVIFAPRMANAIGSGGEQTSTWSEDGRLVFEGTVDFSPKRSLTAGGVSSDGLLEGFATDGFVPTPGAVADANWSSYVVLPGGDVVVNAQMVANSTGIHDRIPNPAGNGVAQQDDQNNPNLSKSKASVVMQLLDGWHEEKPYYFHIVTDTSDPAPSAIELGVYAPKLANLNSFGEFPGGSMLPFSPVANGRVVAGDDGYGVQGLNAAVLSDLQVQDPTNTFPIDPDNELYAPMWDAHINEFTIEENEDRPILRSFAQIEALLESGDLIPFRGNGDLPNFENSLSPSGLLMPTGAIINCPVITQPNASVIVAGDVIGDATND